MNALGDPDLRGGRLRERKPGEQNNPVVETVSMNDLRYNMYGGARYPAPAVIGSYSGAVAGAFRDTAAQIARPRSSGGGSKPAKKAPPAKPSIEVYRGTTSNSYKVGS